VRKEEKRRTGGRGKRTEKEKIEERRK